MNLIDRHTETVGKVTSRLLIGSLAGVALLTALADTPVAETIRVSLVVAIQVCTGATMWRLFRYRQICTMPELFGMGLALGSFVSLLSSQALRVTPFNEVAWALPTVFFAILIWFPRIRDRLALSRIEKSSPFTLLVITSATLIALNFWWWWLWPIVPAPAVVFFSSVIHKSWKQQPHESKVWKALTRSSIPVTVLLLIGMVTLAVHFRRFNLNWWIFSYDQVFSESLSTSLAVWGPSENIQLVGESLSYHWFALAWSGLTTQAGGIGSWVVITKVLPICSFLGAICLTWTCTKAISKSTLSSTISVIVLVLASNSFFLTPTRNVHSPTFIFSMVWLLAFTLILIEGINSRVAGGGFLLGLMMVATLGGKVSHGAIAFFGFALCLLASLIFIHDRHLTRFMLTSAAWLTVACSITFLILYHDPKIGDGSGVNGLRWGFAEIGTISGIAHPDSSMFVRSIAWLGVIGGVTPAMAPIFILFLLPSTRRRVESYFITGAILSSLVFLTIFNHGGSGQIFFYLSGLVISAVGVGWALGEGWTKLRMRITMTQVAISVFVGVCISVLSSRIWNWTPSQFDPYRSSFVIKMILQLILWTGALTVAFLFRLSNGHLDRKRLSVQKLAYVASISLIASAISFGVVQRYNSARNSYHARPMELNDPNLISGSRDHIAALTWLRNHSEQNDVVATNRFCIPGITPCISRWMLVSALSQRRMLIEGGYSNANFPPNLAEKEKFKYSQDFAENPSRQGTRWLLDHRVSWVFIDYVAQESGRRSWEPYGTTVFSNGAASIVKLHQELQTPPSN